MINIPAANVHSESILIRSKNAVSEKNCPSFQDLCSLGVEIQDSLRASRCDSPRINTDPALRLVMVEIGQRCSIDSFADYNDCTDAVHSEVADRGPRGQRARWAQMAQDGASNLTPLARSLHNSAELVAAEAGVPENDPALRLIVHQMAFLANTTGITREASQTRDLQAWCDAQVARIAIEKEVLPAAKERATSRSPSH